MPKTSQTEKLKQDSKPRVDSSRTEFPTPIAKLKYIDRVGISGRTEEVRMLGTGTLFPSDTVIGLAGTPQKLLETPLV